MVGEPGCLKQMVEAYHDLGGNLICTEEVAADQTHKYGILTPGAQAGPITEVKGLVEKPAADVAPSRLAIIGRYILQPEVMDVLGSQEEGAGGETNLTDALARLIGRQPSPGVPFSRTPYDCGRQDG